MSLYYRRPDLAWIPLRDAEPLRIVLAWDPQRASATVRAFVSAASAELTEAH